MLATFALLAPGALAAGAGTQTARAARSAAPSVRAGATAPLGGVNLTPIHAGESVASIDREIAAAHALHARIVRVEIPWSDLEPLASGELDAETLAITDRLVADAAADGIRVIAFVESTPCWASSSPASLLRACRSNRPSAANSWPPTDPSGYASFVARLAARYGTRLAAIEVWNEPDQINEHYFAGPEKPARYAAILRAAYTAIKQANPQVAVLAGSLVGSNGVFLRRLYAAGIKGYYDGIAVHFYTLVLASLREFRQVQLANGDSAPLWLDEFGWSSCWPRKIQQEQACVTQRLQGSNLATTVRSLARTPWIASEDVYSLQGSTSEDFGVLNARGAPKPAFAALASAFSSPFAAVARPTLELRRVGDHVTASGSGPAGDFLQLEASVHGALRYRATFALDRFNRYSLTLPSVIGTHRLSVRVYQLWAGAAHAAHAARAGL